MPHDILSRFKGGRDGDRCYVVRFGEDVRCCPETVLGLTGFLDFEPDGVGGRWGVGGDGFGGGDGG